jgi:hypothetical protein
MVSTFGRKASVEPATPIKHPVLLAMGILTSQLSCADQF